MCSSRSHWENIYTTKSETTVSWFQLHPERSLESIEAVSPVRKASVIDVGGGASTLVDDLLVRGFGDLTVLDIAATALERSKRRLSHEAAKVDWITADVTRWTPARTWNVWHDRAVFHFLTDRPSQDRYIAALLAATRPGATAVIATFSLDGPETCSGLPVRRYSPEALAARLGSALSLVAQAPETHRTPWGSEQCFCYTVLQRR